MSAERTFSRMYEELAEKGVIEDKDDSFREFMLEDRLSFSRVEDAFYDILDSFMDCYTIFQDTVISEEIKEYIAEIRSRYTPDFKKIKMFMKPLHSSTRIEDYLADDEDNSTSNKVRDAYKNRFINIFNIFRDIHEPSGNEETELKKSAMISEAIKDKVLEELTASKKPAYEFISIDNELYIKADREPARTSILEAEKNESSLSVPAIVELSLNEKISSKQQLEDILTGNFDFTSQDIEKACTALDFAPASEKPKPEIKIKHSMVLSDEVINSFVYIPKGDVVEAAPAPLTSALNMDDYTIGLYKASPDLNTDHLWAYLSGIDNFSKAEEIGSFFKKEAELKGAYKSAYDAIIDSSVKLILERKLPAEDAVTDELLMDKFGISKDFINILEALNLVVRTDENFLIVLSPLIRNFFNFKTKTETFYATTMKNFMPD